MRQMIRNARRVPAALIVLLCVLTTPLAYAEEDSGYELWVYAWLTALDGNVAVGPLESEVNASFSDVLEGLDFAFMAALRSEQGPWVWTVDVFTANLTNDFARSVTVKTDQQMLRATGGVRLESGMEFFIGARAIDIRNPLRLRLPDNTVVSSKGSKSWVDPIVGMGYRGDLTDRLELVATTDIGGFGIASDLSWSATAMLRYHFSERFSMSGGYRILDIDYEEGRGNRKFGYDVDTSGPAIALAWQF